MLAVYWFTEKDIIIPVLIETILYIRLWVRYGSRLTEGREGHTTKGAPINHFISNWTNYWRCPPACTSGNKTWTGLSFHNVTSAIATDDGETYQRWLPPTLVMMIETCWRKNASYFSRFVISPESRFSECSNRNHRYLSINLNII